MTVKELIEALEAFGDDLQVEAVNTNSERRYNIEVDSQSRSDGVFVQLWFDPDCPL